MKVKIINKIDGSIYAEKNAVRVATRELNGCMEFVVYSGGMGYAYSARSFDIVIEERI